MTSLSVAANKADRVAPPGYRSLNNSTIFAAFAVVRSCSQRYLAKLVSHPGIVGFPQQTRAILRLTSAACCALGSRIRRGYLSSLSQRDWVWLVDDDTSQRVSSMEGQVSAHSRRLLSRQTLCHVVARVNFPIPNVISALKIHGLLTIKFED